MVFSLVWLTETAFPNIFKLRDFLPSYEFTEAAFDIIGPTGLFLELAVVRSDLIAGIVFISLFIFDLS